MYIRFTPRIFFLMLNYLINYTFKLNISVAFYTKLLLYVHEGKVFFLFLFVIMRLRIQNKLSNSYISETQVALDIINKNNNIVIKRKSCGY